MLLSLGLLLVSCSSKSETMRVELEISELRCYDGLRMFEGRILELEGIKTVTANIESRTTEITFMTGQVSADQIKSHLKEFGFTINGEEGNSVARGRLPQCCFEDN